MSLKTPKVIIVGGSIAGLSLALMLEKNNIDFLVLEGYPSIAPQVGASIGVLPNGLRILDQLGCSEEILAKAEYPVDKVIFRNSQGQPFWSFENFNEQIVGRHGYPIVFLDRRMLIQTLYDHIQQKDKILTSERVVTVKNHPSHVSVITERGNTYTGTFVVGGDGIHSTVRQQMWDDAQKTDPTWFDKSEANAIPATYACIFGISEGVDGIEKGTLSSVFNEHFSYLIPSGPGDRTYWFLVKNMGKTLYGSDIPRFTKDEEEVLAKEHWNDLITPKVRFSDLYKKKLSSVYTALPEYVYKKWHFKRTITIGDAAHKFEPLTGQGGNSAIETAAALANHLVSFLRTHPMKHLSTDDITFIFEQTQSQRENRVWDLVRASHARQRLECMETPFLKFAARVIVPYIPKWALLPRWIQTYSPAVSLNMLPIPRKPREIPYYDELLKPPSSRGPIGFTLYAVFATMAFTAFKLLLTAGKVNGTWRFVKQALMSGSIKERDLELRHTYSGLTSIDNVLKSLVTIFLSAIDNPSNPGQQLHLLYFLSSMLPLIAIFTVEGYRQRNTWTPIASATVWGILYQLRGIGFIAPLYIATTLFVSRGSTFFIQPGREVPAAKFILPALMLGFIVPTMLLFWPFASSGTRQALIALWQPAPVWISSLTTAFSAATAVVSRIIKREANSSADTNSDLPHLRTIYQTTGAIAACFHLSLIIGSLVSSELSLTSLFIPKNSFAPVESLADGVFVFFQNDFLLVAAAAFLWCLVSIWDLNRSGLSDVDLRVVFCAISGGYAAIGPGATTAAVWFWREGVMSRVPSRLSCEQPGRLAS
ncbi:FAD-dependent oxidoreductase [Aspergillus udagawae]|uniref:FAD-binding domain-containing protein n=1 Tax=Aspergillus udagawae TaxID=91492 RepID=A0A8E0QRH2_9EURO|nr:uncharacterized protein Aud_003857 [Aspergillus udagawae]GIC87473.1 hypothetical protein Aud_003857 [Aspergillus udagawae]